MRVELNILDERIGTEFPLPQYASPGDAGLDLRAMVKHDHLIHPGQDLVVSSGIAIHIGDPGYAGFVLPRSGMGAKNGIVLGNLVGLIDSGYQGDIKLSLWNRGQAPYLLKPGERVAQLVIMPVQQVQFLITDKFTPSARGHNGFGSTGK